MGCLAITWREFISQCNDLVFCPPYLWGKIDSQLLLWLVKCRHHLISRDLIWIKIVVWNYLQTESVIILAIRLAVVINCISTKVTIQSNSWIVFDDRQILAWNNSPATPDHVTSQCSSNVISGFVTSWMWCIATVMYAAQAGYRHQLRLGKII